MSWERSTYTSLSRPTTARFVIVLSRHCCLLSLIIHYVVEAPGISYLCLHLMFSNHRKRGRVQWKQLSFWLCLKRIMCDSRSFSSWDYLTISTMSKGAAWEEGSFFGLISSMYIYIGQQAPLLDHSLISINDSSDQFRQVKWTMMMVFEDSSKELVKACLFIVVQGLVYLIVRSSSDIFSTVKTRSFSFRSVKSTSFSRILALFTDLPSGVEPLQDLME